jgi:hypothetical protein
VLSVLGVLSVLMIACVLRGRGRDGGLLDEALGRAHLQLFLGKFPVALELGWNLLALPLAPRLLPLPLQGTMRQYTHEILY